MSRNSNERSCNWCLLLYPDEDISHYKALEYIKKNYNYAFIDHDMDSTSDGELKKTHTHVVIKFSNQRWQNSIALELGITPNYLERCRNIESALKYLIHFDNEDKYQYDVELVKGPLKKVLLKFLNHIDMTETEKFQELMEFIHSYPTHLSLRHFLEFVCEYQLFDVYRRNAYTFNALIKDHNCDIAMCRKD